MDDLGGVAAMIAIAMIIFVIWEIDKSMKDEEKDKDK